MMYHGFFPLLTCAHACVYVLFVHAELRRASGTAQKFEMACLDSPSTSESECAPGRVVRNLHQWQTNAAPVQPFVVRL